jgi:hypothetical protein
MVMATLAEDGSCVWVFTSSPALGASLGWYVCDLPGGTTPGRELVRMAFVSDPGKVVGYTLSQSKLVEPYLASLKARSLTRVSSDVALSLDDKRIVVVSSETLIDPTSTGPHPNSFIAAALVDVTWRGEMPPAGAYLQTPLQSRGERISVSYSSGVATIAETGENSTSKNVIAYSYSVRTNQIKRLITSQFNPPLQRDGRSAVPRLYDFKSGKAFYDDYLEPQNTRGKFWTEWDKATNRWSRFAVPPGTPRTVLYARGRLLSSSDDSDGTLQLYEASADRKSWKLVGPYIVHARNGADDKWLVQRTTDGALFLAEF